jgi:hypothetical protein
VDDDCEHHDIVLVEAVVKIKIILECESESESRVMVGLMEDMEKEGEQVL